LKDDLLTIVGSVQTFVDVDTKRRIVRIRLKSFTTKTLEWSNLGTMW